MSARDSRVFRDRHGIKIVVLQGGALSSVSMEAFIQTLTSSVFLVALSTLFVDCKYPPSLDLRSLRPRSASYVSAGAVARVTGRKLDTC